MPAGTEQHAVDPTLVASRQRDLLRHLRQSGATHVNELQRATGVSASTVRRDLADLERRGLIERMRGGAQAIVDEPIRVLREVTFADEKRRIGRAAAALIPPGSTVLINGGTTTESFVPHLSGVPGLTVLTNNLSVASLLAQQQDLEVVMLGGVLRRGEMSLLGHLTVANLAEFDVDIAVSSAFGIDPDIGVTGINLLETQTDRALTSVAPLILLVDHSKFGRRGPVKLMPFDDLDTVVTDGPLDEALAARLADHLPHVVVA